MKALIDNDVILKCARYALVDIVSEDFPPKGTAFGVLGSARYVLSSVIAKNGVEAEEVVARVISFIDSNITLEPTPDEAALAAEFEAQAQAQSLFLDAGESILLAILIVRQLPHLITGDKRAINSIERLIDRCKRMPDAVGRLKCLEQMISEVLTVENVAAFKIAVCKRPDVDKALFICCGCSSSEAHIEQILEALASYIAALRTTAPRVLSA